MKKVLLSTLLFLMLPLYCFAETPVPHVTAYGTATIEVVPDEMHWSISIENSGSEIKTLANSHTDNVAAVLLYLRNGNIAEADIQTTHTQLRERWGHKKGRRIKDGFIATTAINFKLTDVLKYQVIWQNLSGLQGVNIKNVSYDYSKRIEVQDKARIMAIQAAEKKARTMANTLKCDIGQPYAIEDLSSHAPDIISNTEMSGGARLMTKASPPSYSLGQIKIERRVKIVFYLKYENGQH